MQRDFAFGQPKYKGYDYFTDMVSQYANPHGHNLYIQEISSSISDPRFCMGVLQHTITPSPWIILPTGQENIDDPELGNK